MLFIQDWRDWCVPLCNSLEVSCFLYLHSCLLFLLSYSKEVVGLCLVILEKFLHCQVARRVLIENRPQQQICGVPSFIFSKHLLSTRFFSPILLCSILVSIIMGMITWCWFRKYLGLLFSSSSVNICFISLWEQCF